MAVYFVYRCHYGTPSEKHVWRFEYDTVLDWAKAIFKQFRDTEEAYKYAKELMGGRYVYSLGSIFAMDEDEEDPLERKPPKTMRDVHNWFGGMYVNEQKDGPHHIQIYTDDDELEMAVYIFDDHYRKANPGKADFLLLDGWELPDGNADGGWEPPAKLPLQNLTGKQQRTKPKRGDPATYAAFLAFYDSSNLELYGGFRIANVQLPDLARYILTQPKEIEMDHDWETLRLALQKYLKAPRGEDAGFLKAIRKQPEELTNWGVYSDWLQERNEPTAGVKLLHEALKRVVPYLSSTKNTRKSSKDMFRVTPHMVQVCFHTARWGKDDMYHQWIFFDNRWAAAHPTLASGILTFASRWDVL
jgi:uncharacterized protein (TIGR02996 family)